MKVKILSDIHLEWGPFTAGEGDVLVLAGDICVESDYLSDERYHKFFGKCVQNYNKIFYTLGNHEYYGGDWNKVEENLRSYLPKGITLLNNESEYYNRWREIIDYLVF